GLCQRTTGYEKIQKNDLWLLSMFEDRHQNRKSKVLTEEIVRTLSTPSYYKDLDRTTLRELIDSEDRLIPDIPDDDVQRVAAQRAPRVQRALMQDLYDHMGSMEIRQEAIERMEVLTTHLVMLSPSTTSTTSSTIRSSHHSSSMMMRRMSSVG
ncbi:hypothetical protein Tco_1544987, partial [Tanacetum coccineum]